MSKFRANYILVILLALLFSVAYTSRLSSVALVIALLLPVFTYILMWINYFTLSVKIDKENVLAEKKEKFTLDIELKNLFLFPAAPVKITGDFSDSGEGMVNKLNIYANLMPFSKVNIPVTNEFKYRGKYEITVDYVEIYDLLKIFNVKKKVGLVCDVIVVPRRLDLDRIESQSAAQSDKPNHSIGNDVNNLSHIREFREGDTLKNIHWKMTAKQDELMVKQYEDDENAGIVIFCDLNCHFEEVDLNYSMTDGVIEIALALSNRLLIDSYYSDVVFKNEKSVQLNTFRVGNFYEYNQLFYCLSTIPITPETLPVSEMLYGYRFSDDSVGAVYIISPVIDGALAETLNNISKLIRGKVVFICVDYSSVDADVINAVINSGIEIWNVDINNIKESVNFYLQ